MYLQDSHGMQGRGGFARSTVSFDRESGRQLTGFGRETRTIPPSGGILQAQVHHNRTLHLGNVNVPPSRPAIDGSEDGGSRRAASGRKRGRPRIHQLLMHLREERNRGRAWSRATARAEEPILGTGSKLFSKVYLISMIQQSPAGRCNNYTTIHKVYIFACIYYWEL